MTKLDLDAIAARAREAKGRAAERERRYPAGDGIAGCDGYVGQGIDADRFILDGEFTRDELLRLAEVLGFADVPVLAADVLALVERVRELEAVIKESLHTPDAVVQKLANGLLSRQDKIRAPRIDGDHPAGMDAAEAALTAIDDLSAELDKMRGRSAMPKLECRSRDRLFGNLSEALGWNDATPPPSPADPESPT